LSQNLSDEVPLTLLSGHYLQFLHGPVASQCREFAVHVESHHILSLGEVLDKGHASIFDDLHALAFEVRNVHPLLTLLGLDKCLSLY
jgi:hypothetical protein